MKYFTILVLMVISIHIQAQTSDKFADLIEVVNDGEIKIYLDNVFQIAYKDCADYYILANFDDNLFQLKDTLRVFYMNNKPYLLGKVENGRLQGNFKTFHENGMLKLSSQYENGKPVGIWTYYYDNGNLRKMIEFKDNRTFLREMYDKNGKTLAKNGNGKFVDAVSLSTFDAEPYQIVGAVKNGLPDGKWEITLREDPFVTEFFEGNIFREGISHSRALGDYKYFKNHQASFTDVTSITNLKMDGPKSCGEKFNIGLSREFFDRLRKKYKKSVLKSQLVNQWFFVEVKANENGKIKGVKIISKSDKQSIDQLKKLISSVGKTYSHIIPYDGNKYFPVVISESNIYFRNEKEINL